MFAVEPRDSHKLVEDPATLRTITAAVPLSNRRYQLAPQTLDGQQIR